MNAEYQLAHYCQEIKLFLHTVCMDGLIRLCTTARNRNFQGEKVELATASGEYKLLGEVELKRG